MDLGKNNYKSTSTTNDKIYFKQKSMSTINDLGKSSDLRREDRFGSDDKEF